MQPAIPDLRVKIPCEDERDFQTRFGSHVAAKGLRVPTEQNRPVGTRLWVALEFRDGGTLCGEAVVDAHVKLDSRPGVSLRFLRLEREEDEPLGEGPPPLSAPPRLATPSSPPPFESEPVQEDEPLAELPDAAPPAHAPAFDPFTTSGEIVAPVNRRLAGVRRAVIAVAAAGLVIAGAGYAVARRTGEGLTPQSVVAARLQAADRLLSEGRLYGEDGALELLLAARRMLPNDKATAARLSQLADMLETLGARALDRGDLALAKVHLAAAEQAAPGRASVRAKLASLDAKSRAETPRTRRSRTAQRPAASR